MPIRYDAYSFIFLKGRYDDAITMYNEVIETELVVLGEKHPSLLTIKHSLACCLENQGKYFYVHSM